MAAIVIRPSLHSLAGDMYIRALALGLAGYAILGKGFAYLGAPPLYVGEILLSLGIVAMLGTGCVLSTLTSIPNLVLILLGAWTLARTFPFLGVYGMDALRDSIIVLYGVFAFVVCALLVGKPERLSQVVRLFSKFVLIYGSIAWLFYLLAMVPHLVPTWPNSGLPLVQVRPGEVAVHAAGSAIFALLFFRRIHWVWAALLLLAVGLTAAASRGGMLSIALPFCFAVLVAGKLREAMKVVVFGAVILVAGQIVLVSIPSVGGDRSFNLERLALNMMSILFETSEAGLDGTKLWRLYWWEEILRYTVHGPYFWSGKGFGIGLAEADGFMGATEPGAPILRSPHNVNMTILARAGVPGLLLWLILLASWLTMMMGNMIRARRRGHPEWADLFLFVVCYLTSIVINASFDVALEGPMLGIWFWVLFGFGIGMSMIYRARCSVEGRCMATWPPRKTSADVLRLIR